MRTLCQLKVKNSTVIPEERCLQASYRRYAYTARHPGSRIQSPRNLDPGSRALLTYSLEQSHQKALGRDDSLSLVKQNLTFKSHTLILFGLFLLLLGQSVNAASGFSFSNQKQPLPSAEAAFVYSASVNEKNQIIAHWDIAPGYYLYRKHFAFSVENSTATLGPPQFPEPKILKDKIIGEIQVYEEDVNIIIPIQTQTSSKPFVLVTHYQGCVRSGLCYLPITKKITLSPLPHPTTSPSPISKQNFLVEQLASKPFLIALLLFFGLGIGLSFTPCVLPMIPILSSIIVGEAEVINTKKAFWLSLTYVLAMAIAYALLGALAGAAGHNLQLTFQHPVAIGVFAGLFVLLALSMFGLYDIKLPHFVHQQMTKWHMQRKGGDFFEAAGMGFFSTLLISPCLTPVLAAALIYLSNTGDIARGASALFAMGLGMGVPLMAVGILEGRFLPKAGDWMQTVKSIFGVLLLLVAISMIDKLTSRPVILFLLGTVAIVFGMYSMTIFPNIEKKTHPGWWAFWRGLSLVLIAWGGLLLIGASAGNQEIYAPLKGLSFKSETEKNSEPASLYHTTVASSEALSQVLAFAKEQHKAVAVNFTASWCVYCKSNENFLNEKIFIQKASIQVFWVKADMTDQTDATKALMKQYNVVGLPTLLLFDKKGNERTLLRMVGDFNKEELLQNLRRITQ